MSTKEGKIYLISNDINDKVYVGQTIQTLKKRFNGHCCYSKSDRSDNMYIKKAIHKYGKEHFTISLLETCKIENIDEREIYWISKFDSYNKGYNLTKGGKESNSFSLNCLEFKIDIEKFKSYIIEFKPLATEVASHFGISKCSVYNLLNRLNDPSLILNSYHPRISNAEKYKKQICEKYIEGYNIQDLIKMFKSSKKYISAILKSNNITIQRNRKHRI